MADLAPPPQQQQPPQDNLNAARAQLGLTPQEVALYQRHLANLYGAGGVDNADGSRSSLYQTSFEQDGRTYNVPTVYDGKIVHPEEAIQRARAQGLQNFPAYGSQDEAEARYQQMHQFMDRDTGQFFQQRNQGRAPPYAVPPFTRSQTRLGTQ